MQSTDKSTLRKFLRQKRRNLDALAQQTAAKNLLTQLLTLDTFVQSEKIAMYLANDGEIAPSEVQQWLYDNGKRPFLPIVRQSNDRNSLLFTEAKQDAVYAKKYFGISEPVVDDDELVLPTELDMVLLPLVGFDQNGNRIGMGGGFYDTTFEFLKDSDHSKSKPMLIGLAHECQKVALISAESWDIPLSIVVTDQQVYQLGK